VAVVPVAGLVVPALVPPPAVVVEPVPTVELLELDDEGEDVPPLVVPLAPVVCDGASDV
jgi:hypothetical protein